MSTKIEQAVKEICKEHLTPGYYLGVKDKSIDKTSSFWRSFMVPMADDIVHDKKFMFWHEFRKKYPHLMPTDICPCDEGDYIATSNSYIERAISQGYWWLGFPVDCDFTQFLQPGENPFSSRSFQQSVRDHFLDLRDKLFMGFDQKEEYWSAMMMMHGSLIVRPKGGKPYELKFERDCDLNCVITDPECMWCQNPKEDGNKARPWDDIRYMQEKIWDKNRGFFDVIIANRRTCNWMMTAVNKYIEKCKDISTAEVLLPRHLTAAAGFDLPPPMDGARLAFAIPNGERTALMYCVDTNFVFCDNDTGKEVCVNPLADGKVYFFNRNGGGTNQLGARMAFGRIHNYNATQAAQKRFFHQHITPSGKSLKYHGESSPTILIECPNGSACLDVCGGKIPEYKPFENLCSSIEEQGKESVNG